VLNKFGNTETVFIFATAYNNISVVLKGLGEILKRPTRADCKSADYVFVGSNPTLPTKTLQVIAAFFFVPRWTKNLLF
jgi:hypothetical protein